MKNKYTFFLVGLIFLLFLNCNKEKTSLDFDSEEHFFYVSDYGDIQHVTYNENGLKFYNLTETEKIPKAIGNPSASYNKGILYLSYKDSLNSIQTLEFYNGVAKNITNWTEAANAPKANGSPSVTVKNDSVFLFYRDSANDIQCIVKAKDTFLSKNWTLLSKSTKILSNPASLVSENGLNVFFRDSNNDIQNINLKNGKFEVSNWSILSNSEKAINDPTCMYFKDRNQEHVFFSGREHKIQHIILDENGFRTDCWSNYLKKNWMWWKQYAKKLKSSSSPTSKFSNYRENVYYIDFENNIQHFYLNDKFNITNLTKLGNLPVPNSNLAVVTISKSN